MTVGRERRAALRLQVARRIAAVGSDVAMYDVNAIAAEIRRARGDWASSEGMRADEFWAVAVKHRQVSS